MKFPNPLISKITSRKNNNSFRTLTTSHERIDFSSNDYLGFSRLKTITKAVESASKKTMFVNGSTGSRLLSGNHAIHIEVENKLAGFFKTPSALLFNSGYDANLGLLSSVPQRGDIVLFDELCHASIRDGIRLSNATSYSFKHNSISDLKKKYLNTKTVSATIYIVVESIYSMDGDRAPLKDISEFCAKHSCYLIVDEAHATGVFGTQGKGLIDELCLGDFIFARVITFGKALGCHGAVILGSNELRNYLINFSRPFIYTTAMPIHAALTIKFALNELEITDQLTKLKRNIRTFMNGIKIHNLQNKFIESESAIQSCIIGDPLKAKDIASKIRKENYDVKAILFPTVALGTERIRFCIHSYNSTSEIEGILHIFSNLI
ncbi:8-amino-7-oxononanoate synthase [Formosa sp. Hel1_33_131]|jgi:8-amino-7-oxononanoate synthase|uniref:aminotransferase class I/II-fold pyridoxal phosphate-dependent enzyme n=1 Tax=Formosa sp. Hel1_33_131 TaxID=1336794 RepID=UPI00084E2117|nr:pyridoxal phosphate-dependent aminotransferase family protein [Formosa sp. Hel1_33_131]AOR29322.1 8-amino-7-oxononanoate synthase [Formosa sp. Hel1_33_131]